MPFPSDPVRGHPSVTRGGGAVTTGELKKPATFLAVFVEGT